MPWLQNDLINMISLRECLAKWATISSCGTDIADDVVLDCGAVSICVPKADGVVRRAAKEGSWRETRPLSLTVLWVQLSHRCQTLTQSDILYTQSTQVTFNLNK